MNSTAPKRSRRLLLALLCLALPAGFLFATSRDKLAERPSENQRARKPAVSHRPAPAPASPAQSGGGFNLTQSVIPGGGGTSANGNTNLTGSIGQSVAATSSDGQFSVNGGFWSGSVGGGCSALTVNPANPALPAGTAGQPYSQSFTATGGSAPHTFTVSTGALPAGLNLAAIGALSGTPTGFGDFNFTVTATDANNCTGERAYTLVINAPPAISAVAASRQAGSPAANSTIAQVSDANQAANTLSVTVNGGASASVGGVTVSGLSVSAAGSVSANVVAACTATNASFTLTATDNAAAANNATLNVTVTANAPPTLSYNNQAVAAGGMQTLNPATGPSDNGSIPTIVVQSQGTYTGTLSVNPGTGVISVSGAQPSGTHTITIRATDNCGATTDAQFTLTVGNNPPQISAGGPLTRQQGSAGTSSAIATVSDVETPAGSLTVTATTVPAGLTVTSLSNTNGTVTANVAALCNAAVGTNIVVLTVSDGNNGTATANLTVNVTANSAPGLSYSNQSVAAGGLLLVNPVSGPSDNGVITTIAVQSQGTYTGTLSVNPSTGVVTLSGAQPGGTHIITMRATDNCSTTTDAQFTLTVNCLTITVNPESLPNGQIGAAYSQQLTQTGGTGTLTWSSSGALPNNVTLNATTGLLAGTPTVSGTFNFTARVTDAQGCFGERSYTLVIGACPAITITPATLPAGMVGAAYNQTLTAAGGTPAYSFALNAGGLPAGVNLAANGALTGTPSAAGAFNFTVKATDANACMATQAYTLTINPPCGTITINPASLPNGFVGTGYNQTLTASGGAPAYTFTLSAGSLPGGVTLAASGTLSGTPTAAGTFNFTLKATDANGCMGTRVYTVLVSGAGLLFYPLPRPVRLLDTRPGAVGCDAPGLPIPGNTSRTQTAAGRTCDGINIPASARALTGNITTVDSGGGFLTLYPSDATQPLVANSNFLPNEIINNVFTVGLGAGDGAFKIFVTSTTHVVVDVTGYYAPPAAAGLFFHPLPKPIRLLETRLGQTGCFAPGAPIQGGVDTTQQARLTCDGITIPASARAIVGNATVVNPGGGFLTLYPADATRPLVANSNYAPGQIMNAPFTVGLSAGGAFNLFATSTTDLVIDVLGYYSAEVVDQNGAGLLFTPLARPVRLLETRDDPNFIGCFKPNAPLQGGVERTQPTHGVCDGVTIPSTARGIVGNATVVNGQGGFLTCWPSDATRPLAATSNFAAGQIFNRHFTVGLGQADGAFKIFAPLTTDLVIDVAGFFAP